MRGFETAEFEGRVSRAQAAMRSAGLDAMFFTTEPEIRYFTGYLTRFWESPSRPWFLLLPQSGKPVAVIPSIGAALMSKTWITDIRTWSSPDLEDDGLSLLASAIKDRVSKSGRIAVPSGHETHLRMPLSDFERLKAALPLYEFTSDQGIMRSLRMVKSEA
ncbi:MAG: aminopeptidase P family N-terminal domain-containing protein, partial [Paracoccaceae bacterium]